MSYENLWMDDMQMELDESKKYGENEEVQKK